MKTFLKGLCLPTRILPKLPGWLLEVLSWEWILTRMRLANGGGLVLIRSFLIAIEVYGTTVALKQGLDPVRTWVFSAHELQLEIIATLPWFGAIFAGIYAGLYTRFASQWTYLANLYNQIKAAESSCSDESNAIDAWKAGFFEDADELHLATKRVFASILRSWATVGVQREFVKNTPGGEERLAKLMGAVNRAYERHARRYSPPKREVETADAESCRSDEDHDRDS